MTTARDAANTNGWSSEHVEEVEITLKRVRDEEDRDYMGPARGLTLRPHHDCEPLHLVFDSDLFCQDYVKTQFAPLRVHKDIVGLLRTLVPLFVQLEVDDEGEFWATQDEGKLVEHMETVRRVIEEYVATGRGRGPVHIPGGRIIDVIRSKST